ncbi:MAG: HipA domain-containing protein, partial [Planctomycetota bacterium]
MADLLHVFHGQRQAGDLRRRADGQMTFVYAGTWLDDESGFPISGSLPLSPAVNADPAAHAFFANLLPEGALREAVARQLGISVSNDFALLEAVGGECAGALSLLPEGQTPDGASAGYEPLSTGVVADMARRFSVLPEASGRRPRLSLAGAQDKLPVRRDDDGSLWLPTGGAPSTHILKVPSRDFRHLPANEVLSTRLAREAGLATTDIEMVSLEEVAVAVVRRYDRKVEGSHITRLHQEDLCQALGLMPGMKYEREGGPGFVDAMRVVRERS